MLVDSHCHLNMLKLAEKESVSDIVERASAVGVEYILCVGTEIKTFPYVLAIAEKFENVFASVGLHPSENCEQEPTVEDLVALADHPKVVAIGEGGLDYYYNETGLENMRERFRLHLRAAKAVNKPMIIHSRSAHQDTIRIMQEEQAEVAGGVMHCFTESWEMAQEAMEMGYYISFSGIVTFKNAKNVQEVASKVPLERLLIETDAPYLTPDPFRGKPNEPQYVRFVAQKIAELKQVSYDDVIEKTGENFLNLFQVAR